MNVLVPLVEGFEDVEAISVIDLLRRAGINVVTAGSPSSMIKSAHNVTIMTDKRFDEINPDEFDAIILIGGDPGYKNLGRSSSIMKTVKDFNEKNKVIGAICAAPLLLAQMGLLEGKKATIYPGMERNLPRPRADRVVVDGNIVTSQGPGTAMEFAIKIIEVLGDKIKAEKVKREVLC